MKDRAASVAKNSEDNVIAVLMSSAELVQSVVLDSMASLTASPATAQADFAIPNLVNVSVHHA